MNIKNFKTFLLEEEQKVVKTETPKPVPKIGVGNQGQIKAPVKVEEPKEEPKETPKAEEPKKPDIDAEDPFEGNEQVRRIYSGLVAAEHTAEFSANKKRPAITNPLEFNERLYKRTEEKSGVSSAYGPVQIVRNTAKGFLKTRPDLFKGNEEYAQQFVEQGNKFLSAKGTPGKYGPGCTGDLCDEKYHKPYQKLAVSIIKGKAAEKKIDLTKPMTEKDVETFVGYWRGATKDQDPRYFKAFGSGFQPKTSG